MPKGEHLRSLTRAWHDCTACGWGGTRYPGSIKPCPDCGGTVVVRKVRQGQRLPRGDTKPLRVRLSPEEIAELETMGAGGRADVAAEQVIRAHLAHRLAERLAGR